MDNIYTKKGSLAGHIFDTLTNAQIEVIYSFMPCMETFQLKPVFYQKFELKNS